MSAIVDEIRTACAWVAGRALHVEIIDAAIEPYARALRIRADSAPIQMPKPALTPAEREKQAAFWLTLDAINFGSGWFPTLRKRPGLSGYRTIATGVEERFAARGPWSATELAEIDAAAIAVVVGQNPDHDLMELFAASLRDLGSRLVTAYDGSFTALVAGSSDSAVALVELLSDWPCFADTSTYEGRTIPFLKRAQIVAADLDRAGATEFADLRRLTMFADNLVPHVLRLDGVLRFDRQLVKRIQREELIEHGSPEEVEIRSCAVHALELIAAARPDTCPAEIDGLLWHRGGKPRYKASPRHRCRCTAY